MGTQLLGTLALAASLIVVSSMTAPVDEDLPTGISATGPISPGSSIPSNGARNPGANTNFNVYFPRADSPPLPTYEQPSQQK